MASKTPNQRIINFSALAGVVTATTQAAHGLSADQYVEVFSSGRNATIQTIAVSGIDQILITTVDSHYFDIGQNIYLTNTINYDGGYVVVSTPLATTFTVRATYVTDETAGSAVAPGNFTGIYRVQDVPTTKSFVFNSAAIGVGPETGWVQLLTDKSNPLVVENGLGQLIDKVNQLQFDLGDKSALTGTEHRDLVRAINNKVSGNIGTIDSRTKSLDGAVIYYSDIYMQTADATHPGLVSTGTQTFAGDKTFNDDIILNSFTVAGIVRNSAAGLLSSSATISAGEITGLGTMAAQNSNSVSITGGAITGTTFGLTASQYVKTTAGGLLTTTASIASSDVTGLTASQYVKTTAGGLLTTVSSVPSSDVTGLGTMAAQNSNSVSITGGSIPTSVLTGLGSISTTTSGVTIANGTNSTVGPAVTVNIADAGPSSYGLVTTGTQTFAGAKTFSGNLTASGTVTHDTADDWLLINSSGHAIVTRSNEGFHSQSNAGVYTSVTGYSFTANNNAGSWATLSANVSNDLVVTTSSGFSWIFGGTYGDLRPVVNNTQALGLNGYQWSTVHTAGIDVAGGVLSLRNSSGGNIYLPNGGGNGTYNSNGSIHVFVWHAGAWHNARIGCEIDY